MNKKIKVNFNKKEYEVENGTKIYEFCKEVEEQFQYPILLSAINNEFVDLRNELNYDCELQLFDLTSRAGYRIYQTTTTFLMIYAIKEVLGMDTKVTIEYSIDKNYYCNVDKEVEINEEVRKKVNDVMLKLVEKKQAIEKVRLTINELEDLVTNHNLSDKMDVLRYTSLTKVDLYKIFDVYDYFYMTMPMDFGVIGIFELDLYNNGFIIRFANRKKPNEIKVLKELSNITRVFEESTEFAKILEADTVGALNKIISSGQFAEFVRVNEALHEKKVSSIADQIKASNKKLVLIAGPTSSGKTTFSKKLNVQLKIHGLKPVVIGLDDYYVNRDEIPVDENGEKNYENIETLEIEMINRDLKALLKGERIELPHFDFKAGVKKWNGNFVQLEENSVIIIEGIHGLNDKLTYAIPKDNKFKIFISALTQLNIDEHNRIPTADTRLIRRIVRDNKHRGFDASVNLKMWPKVIKGEADNIFPYQEEADAIFNSALMYEFCVLKPYILPLLYAVPQDSYEYLEARRLIKFLEVFIPVSSEEVPNNSLLREFIGGSVFA